jgi:anionic cell wall polymer biosynthesis LytR-Cps2A-Psr (LCP) family protein
MNSCIRIARHLAVVLLCCLVACTSNDPQEPAKQDTVDSSTASDTTKKPSPLNADGIDTTAFSVTDSTVELKSGPFPKPGGRVVNVMVTGVDARLGSNTLHADANHLIRFFLDSGCVEIISIPRDTEADAGFDDTTGLNRLTNVRANRSRESYHKAVAEITGVTKVDHWVEFGFSQAIGLLELFGYRDNATSTLRVLRSRQAYASGDFQRSYNQGQFIRQLMLRHFQNTDGIVGDIAIRAALALVETDLTYDRVTFILDELRSHGFGTSADRAWVRLKPSVIAKFKVYDFNNENVNQINTMISQKVSKLGLDSVPITTETYERRLNRIIEGAAADSAKSPQRVIGKLRRPYEQRAWLQVPDRALRRQHRDRLTGLLISAYQRTKNQAAVDRIRQYLELEDKASQ